MFHDVKHALNVLSQLQCKHVYFMLGNHDNALLPEAIRQIRESGRKNWHMVGDMFGLSWYRGDQKHPLYVHGTHYPMARWDRSHYGSYNTYGHCHGQYEKHRPPNALQEDVGIDVVRGYMPTNLWAVDTNMQRRAML